MAKRPKQPEREAEAPVDRPVDDAFDLPAFDLPEDAEKLDEDVLWEDESEEFFEDPDQESLFDDEVFGGEYE